MRFEEQKTCIECMKNSASCGGKGVCNPARTKLRRYGGIRFTSDGFDCAFPVSIDSHSVCSFGCLYCFAPNTIQGREKTQMDIGQTSLKEQEGDLKPYYVVTVKGGRDFIVDSVKDIRLRNIDEKRALNEFLRLYVNLRGFVKGNFPYIPGDFP